MPLRGRVQVSGGALVVEGPDPVMLESLLGRAPGVAWIAVGMATASLNGVGGAAGLLAKRYVRNGSRFKVEASGGEGASPSDVGGAVVSAVLEEVGRARVDEERPQVVFRAVMTRSEGAVGVELARGPGGVPTGSKEVTCLVSGGMHSSVLSWVALLSGYRLRMVHAKADEESVLAVARLYSELSHRVDPSALTLEVLAGAEGVAMLNWVSRRSGQPVFVGSHSGCSSLPEPMGTVMQAPLYLAQEEWFISETSGLSLRPLERRLRWVGIGSAPDHSYHFGGVRADVSGVMDGLRLRSPSGR